MTTNKKGLSEGEKEKLKRAAIKNEREATKYGSGLPEGHRDNDDGE
jgi:hypothetical protein